MDEKHLRALNELVSACESDFLSDDTEEGEWSEPDDEPVAMGQTAEGKPIPSSVTFGSVRRAREAIDALMSGNT